MPVRKQRLDKYYHLAKDRGYRTRSAFKLLELNRKYNFLKDARIAVDLCAAPGGWLQILAQEMPPVRKIIGVDLDAIKPLGGDTITFVGDITTKECRRTLISLLDGHQADIFVHDGAPNFGASKDRDVFVQNDLVLSALRLSCEFLREGGTFVSKVFRSEQFTRILGVFEQLFGSVDITKPLSSRSESAEIFAVCRRYKAPEHINPALFDSSVLFADDSPADEDYLRLPLSSFILAPDPSIITRCLQLIPDFDCALLTDEIKELLSDIKLLAPKDIKTLLKLRAKIIKKIRSGNLTIEKLAGIEVRPAQQNSETTSKEHKTANNTPNAAPETKLEDLKKQLDKLIKKEEREEQATAITEIPEKGFYNGRLFRDFDSTDGDSVSTGAASAPAEEEPAEISVSSCSDSMEMTESELRCALALKQKGEEAFLEDTIDRYLVSSEEDRLPNEKRPVKIDTPPAEKKKVEFLSRKKARAMRRAAKVMKDIIVEDEEEEAVVYKKVYRNLYKRERPKPRLVFPGKGGRRARIPRGKGKLKFLDRRMKHDLRLEKKRVKK